MSITPLSVLFCTASFAAAVTCNLNNSGPVAATQDGQVIENLRITANGQPAVVINGKKNVVLRNLVIRHAGSHGIKASDADDLLIEHVDIENTGAPTAGPHSHPDQNNIQVDNSPRVRIDQVRLVRGSSGAYFYNSPNAHLSFVEGYDFRGPFPRGQLAQWNSSANSILEDFSVINPQNTSWVEDNVNVYGSPGVIVRRGLIDGNNSPSGIGVIFDGGEGATGSVQDVDAIRMGNGCFSNYAGGRGNTFERANCKDIICGSQGRPWNDNPNNYGPMSGGLMYTGTGGVGNYGLKILDSKYSGACGGVTWPAESFSTIELREENFTPRPAIVADVCGTTSNGSSSSQVQSSSSIPASSSSSAVVRNGRIEAETFDAQQGIVSKGTVIGQLDEGDWARYNLVEFSPDQNMVRISVAVDPDYSGQQISIRLDGVNGQEISRITVPNTGGWTTFVETMASVQSTNGVHTLYLIPLVGNGKVVGVADVDWFEFYADNTTSVNKIPNSRSHSINSGLSYEQNGIYWNGQESKRLMNGTNATPRR